MRAKNTWRRLVSLSLLVGLASPTHMLAAEDQSSAGAPPALRGLLPANATVLGHSLTDLATAWLAWAAGTPPPVNPLLAIRCEQSPLDPRIWFLPVSLGGESTTLCYVPRGSFVVLIPGGFECSEAEGHGSTAAELKACVDENFALLSYVEVTFNDTTATNLDDYITTTRLVVLPPDNLNGPDPTPAMLKGYFLVLAPLSPGTHTLRAYDEFAAFDFQAGITYTIVVR